MDSLTPNSLTLNPDTILIREKEEIVRYRLRCDTVERVKFEVIRDSIPYEVRITEVKEVRKPPNIFDYLCYLSLGILAGMIGIKLTNTQLTKLLKF